MIKITYPGVNNFSTFAYDGISRNVSIVETTGGSVTSTKQFVWNVGGTAAKEERDGFGALTKKFFNSGQMNNTTKYFYNRDNLGSVREMADNSGAVQAQYTFDPFGRVKRVSELAAADFGYAGYYIHSRSSLNLTRTRFYNANLARFISRDPIEENGGNNLFAYVLNAPMSSTDPVGLTDFNRNKTPLTIRQWCIRNCLQHQLAAYGLSEAVANLFPSLNTGGVGIGTWIGGVGVEFTELMINIVNSALKGRITGSLRESLSSDTPQDIRNDVTGINTFDSQRRNPGGGGIANDIMSDIQQIIKNCFEQCKCKSDTELKRTGFN